MGLSDFGIRDFIIVLLVVALGYVYFFPQQPPKIVTVTKYEQIKVNVVRADSTVVDNIVVPESTDKEITRRIEKKNVNMTGQIRNVVRGNLQGNKSDVSESATKHKAVRKDIFWIQEDGTKFPIATAMYRPSKDRWNAIAYGLYFDTSIVQQKNYDGSYETFVESWATHKNLKMKHGGGERFPLEIKSATFKIKHNDVLTWSAWNPTLMGGTATSVDNTAALLKFNFINYGYDSQLPVYSFLSPTLSIHEDGKIDFGIELGSVNIGEYIPVIKDVHIGIGINTNKLGFLSIASVF